MGSKKVKVHGSKKAKVAAKKAKTVAKPVVKRAKQVKKSGVKAVAKSTAKSAAKPAAKADVNPVAKSLKTPGAVAATFSAERPGYLPREGSLPDMIFRRLLDKPMPYGELARHLEADSKLTGDALTSQLSAALYDLCNKRGVLVRVDYDTLQPVPASRSRGALYTVADRARAGYEARSKLSAKRSGHVGEPGQLDLSSFGSGRSMNAMNGGGGAAIAHAGDAMLVVLPKPERMSDAMYAELRAARQSAADQIRQATEAITAIDRLLKVPSFS